MATSITSAVRRACSGTSGRSKCGKGCPCLLMQPTRELRALADEPARCGERCSRPIVSSFGDVELVVHHPPRPEWERQRVRNDDSEVLEIRYGGVSFVFTGDIGREVERTIAPSFARAPDSHPQGAAPRQRDLELADRFSTRCGPTSPSSAPGAGTHSAIRCRACWSGTGTSAPRSTAPIRTAPCRWRRTARL